MKFVCSTLCFLTLVVALTHPVSPASAQNNASNADDAVAFLTNGVDSIPVFGVPGPIVSFDDSSFPVVLAQYEGASYAPVVSAAFVEKGRVLAYGHTDYCSADAIGATESSKKFFINALLWAAGKTDSKPGDVKVAVLNDQKTASFLKNEGFETTVVNDLKKDFDVLVAGAVSLNDKQYDELFTKVKNGAGFITCGLGWGWSQLNPGKDLIRDHNGNRNFAKNGVSLAWTAGTLSATKQGQFAVAPDAVEKVRFSDGAKVLELIKKLSENSSEVQEQLNQAGNDGFRQITTTLALDLPFLPADKVAVVDKLTETFSDTIIPSAQNPVKKADILKRSVITILTERYLHGQAAGVTDAKDVPALAASSEFPGSVPSDAKRLSDVSVKIKTAVPDWASTGLYAAPGEKITVKIDPEIFAKFPKPFKVRIGAHADSIMHLQKWTRYPEITIEKTIEKPETTIANPFGGNIYIVVPHHIGSQGLGLVEFKISGAVVAPYFIRDVTSLDEWKNIRENPAPWAELQGRNVIVTVPSKVIRNLDDPQQLLETWDEILALEAEFASGPYVRERPERIVCDREISAGYMHSGYPVMTHMDVEKDLVDNERLRKEGDWGFYHEFGHNHQSSNWTFEGTVEVTVNYFTLYIMEKFNGRRAEDAKSDLTKEAQARMLQDYFNNGAKFSDWKANPFLALLMTIQMREEFGWEPFLRSVSEYKKAPASELPKNDQEKRDQWMVRLSRNSGLNLGPFFTTWGVPISQEALDSVKDMPIWIPDELKQYAQ